MPLLYKVILHFYSIYGTSVWWHLILCSGDKAWKLSWTCQQNKLATLKRHKSYFWLTQCLMWLPTVTTLQPCCVLLKSCSGINIVFVCQLTNIHKNNHKNAIFNKMTIWSTDGVLIIFILIEKFTLLNGLFLKERTFLPKRVSVYGQNYTWCRSACNWTVVVTYIMCEGWNTCLWKVYD